MWKLGVTHNDAFAREALAAERAGRAWRPFAYTLLEDLQSQFHSQDEPLIERLFQSMAAGDGVFKITRRGRFTPIDQWLIQEMEARRLPAQFVVHDVGCSNAVTSLELWQSLRRVARATVHASDYYDVLYLVTVPGSGWTVAFATDGRPLQFISDTFVLPVQRRESWRYPWNRWLQSVATRDVLPMAERMLRESDATVRRVPLFHPEAVACAATQNSFHLLRHDVFQPNPVTCNAVRAMNVLTPRHFAPVRVQAGIQACLHNIADGGLLILGRNVDEEDGRLRATVYRLDSGKLTPVFAVHEGYEWPDLVESIPQRTT